MYRTEAERLHGIAFFIYDQIAYHKIKDTSSQVQYPINQSLRTLIQPI